MVNFLSQGNHTIESKELIWYLMQGCARRTLVMQCAQTSFKYAVSLSLFFIIWLGNAVFFFGLQFQLFKFE